jgi:hypothetical protein
LKKPSVVKFSDHPISHSPSSSSFNCQNYQPPNHQTQVSNHFLQQNSSVKNFESSDFTLPENLPPTRWFYNRPNLDFNEDHYLIHHHPRTEFISPNFIINDQSRSNSNAFQNPKNKRSLYNENQNFNLIEKTKISFKSERNISFQ